MFCIVLYYFYNIYFIKHQEDCHPITFFQQVERGGRKVNLCKRMHLAVVNHYKHPLERVWGVAMCSCFLCGQVFRNVALTRNICTYLDATKMYINVDVVVVANEGPYFNTAH